MSAELLFDCSVFICCGMPNSGCEHLYVDAPRASAWRFFLLDFEHPLLDADAGGQARRDDAIVAQLPDPSLWAPRPAGLLYSLADCNARHVRLALSRPIG